MLGTFEIEKHRISLCFATQIGKDKKENQDAIIFGCDGLCFALSVCDGLGSAPLSAQGSSFAANLLVDSLIDETFSKEKLQKAWLSRFDEHPQKYNSTAKFISIKNGQVRLGGIGDGIIAIYTKNELSCYSNHGDFSNQTSCIFDLNYDSKFVDIVRDLPSRSVLMICSDGFSEDIKDDGLETLMEAADNSLSESTAAKEFDNSLTDLLINWPNKTNCDDKTVAFIFLEEK